MIGHTDAEKYKNLIRSKRPLSEVRDNNKEVKVNHPVNPSY
jgi:hypothetical protein